MSSSNEEEKRLKWYEDPILQLNKNNSVQTRNSSSLFIVILFLPLILVGFILFIILWILPGFGYFYEKYAENLDRKKYFPPNDEMKDWGPDKRLLHVVHLQAPESKCPPIVYVSGLGSSMYIVKPLLMKFVESMGEPIEIISFDSPGYGASQPPIHWNTINAETELELLRQVIEKSKIRKPFIIFGASAGASLAQFYRLTYPEDISAIILFDPTPSNVFQQGSPMSNDFNRAFSIYKKMARVASWGLMRPLIPLIPYFVTGEFGDIFRLLPPAHLSLFMTKTMLLKTGYHFCYWHEIMNCISNLQNDSTIDKNIPLLVVGALNWTKDRPHGGFTREQMRQWWKQNQQTFLETSNNAGFVSRTDYTHSQCMLDMQLAANVTKAILTQIPHQIVQ